MINIRIDGENRAAVEAAYQLVASALHGAHVQVQLTPRMGVLISEVNLTALKAEGVKLDGL